MRAHGYRTPAYKRLALFEWGSLALAALLALTPAALTAPRPGARPSAAPPSAIVVNTTGDGDNVDADAGCDADAAKPGEQCTLRAAIQRVNALAAAETSAAHTIDFDIPPAGPDCEAATGACVINLTRELPQVTASVTFAGPGAERLTVRRDSNAAYSVFTVGGPARAVTFSGLTIANGHALSGGGGILQTTGRLDVVECAVTANSTDAFGGGIYSLGNLNVEGSTVSGNRARDGGGIVTVHTSTITNNTVSGNSASGKGGGIYRNGGLTTVDAGTIIGNSAAEGGGIYDVANSTNARNTIIAGNTAPLGRDFYDGLVSLGYNLIGVVSHPVAAAAGDQMGTPDAPLDPRLGPLTDNGGPTDTHAPLAGSPALDRGHSGGLSTDQRGLPRPSDDPALANAPGGDGGDVGAFERQPAPTPTPTPTPSATPTPTTTPTPPATSVFHFDAAVYTVGEDCTSVEVRVLRAGPSGAAASVEVASEDNTAKQKDDYTLVAARLTFAPGETEKTFHVLVNEDSYTEGLEFATLVLQHPEGGRSARPARPLFRSRTTPRSRPRTHWTRRAASSASTTTTFFPGRQTSRAKTSGRRASSRAGRTRAACSSDGRTSRPPSSSRWSSSRPASSSSAHTRRPSAT